MTHKRNFIAKCSLPFLLVASFTMLVGCGGSSNSSSGSNNQSQSNVSASTSGSTSNGNSTGDSGKSNSSGNGASKNGSSTDSGTSTSTNNNSSNNDSSSGSTSSSSNSNNGISGSNGITTQAPQGKTIAFDAITDLSSLPPQAQGMVDVHKSENGVFRHDENGSTYILVGSGKSPSAGLTLRAEQVTEENDKLVVTTSEFKPGSAGPTVPYFVIKIKQTSKPVEAYNLGYTR